MWKGLNYNIGYVRINKIMITLLIVARASE